MGSVDYVSELYKQLSQSEQLKIFNERVEEINKNIKDKDYDNLYSILDSMEVVWRLRDVTTEAFKSIVVSLLEDINEDLNIQGSFGHISVDYAYEKLQSYEYKPHHWASPPSNLVYIDFKNKEITVFDSKNEYEKAETYQSRNIAESEKELQVLLNRVAELESHTNSKGYMLNEIRKNLWSIRVFKYLAFSISVCLSKEKADVLSKTYAEIIKNRKKSAAIVGEHIQRMKDNNYMKKYEDVTSLQQKVVNKLLPLGFQLMTEEVVNNLYEEDEDSM